MVDEKSVAVGIGVGYEEHPRWAKISPPVRGVGGFEKPPELYCTYFMVNIHTYYRAFNNTALRSNLTAFPGTNRNVSTIFFLY